MAVSPAEDSNEDWLLLAFEQHFQRIYGYLARRIGADAAEDVAAEVFATAQAQRHRFDPEKGPAVAWLFGIATNQLRSSRRAEKRRLAAMERQLSVIEPATDAVGDLDPVERAALARALASLKADQRDVLLLNIWADLSYEEIAGSLSIPIGTVRSRISRAKNAVQKALEAEGRTDRGY